MKYLPALLLLVLSLTACQDDDDGRMALPDTELTLNFRAEYDGQPLAIQSQTYGYPTGDSLKVLLFQYYISDLALLPADGSEAVKLADIDLLRWDTPGGDAVQTRTYTVPSGEYRGLRFGLGVSPDLNAQDPSNFAADFVLNEAEFWNPATRYVFAKIEANADLDEDGTFDTGLTYHMGADNLYTTLNFTGNIPLAEGRANLIVVADVLEAMSSQGRTFDITDPAQQAVHGGNQEVAVDIWERLAGQFELR